jgi:hypothetical protein
MATVKPAKTLSHIFDEFLADQEDRISHKTYLKYESIISLYKHYLEGYWPATTASATRSPKTAARIAAPSARKTQPRVSMNSSITSCPEKSCAAKT